ncbi:MAG: hypothetical protein WAV78_40550, partial [Xanthobacteraceae bacterium]
SVLNSRIGFSSFPVRVTVGLESNASELALHVEQTVRACAIDYDDRGMATMFGRTGLSGGRQLALVDVAILPTQERKSSVTVMPRHASGSGKKCVRDKHSECRPPRPRQLACGADYNTSNENQKD